MLESVPILLLEITIRNNNLYIDGYKSEHDLQGFLHVGKDYAIFLKKPESHDKYLTNELYEAEHFDDINSYKPRLLAISKVPVDYMREQLLIFRDELYKSKYEDENIVPGTRVITLREWQIDRALNSQNKRVIVGEPNVLRTMV
ncbi:unnamed protein product [Leptidea sinapis]|uniref:Uncharacterized protein n=1 Tax=Leptidea sinapis TaxID=189913 RepID=A0A5E4R204_9NEOP|nr:unnamed protein product [Leptidea sinapis]